MKPEDIIAGRGDDRGEAEDGGEASLETDAPGGQDHTPEGGGAVGLGGETMVDGDTGALDHVPADPETAPKNAGFRTVGPPPQGKAETPDADGGGPFGVIPATPDDPFLFTYFFKPKRVPTDKQLALALRIGDLMQQFSRFKNDPVATKLAEQLRGIFQAGLVQASAAEPEVFERHVTALETDFLNRVVTPAHRERISKPTFNTVYAFVAASILGFLLYYFLQPAHGTTSSFINAEVFGSLLFVVAGTLLGRLFFMVVTHQSMVTSMEQFDTDGARIGTGGFVIFLDAIVGVIAFLVFYTGFLQIAIGAQGVEGDPEQVRSALSTLEIASNPSVAYLFGVIIGIARTQFIARISSLTRERLE